MVENLVLVKVFAEFSLFIVFFVYFCRLMTAIICRLNRR